MYFHVKDLSAAQRTAIESLLGRPLQDDESVSIQTVRVIKEAPTGAERTEAFRKYLNHLDMLAERVKDIPDEEIEAAINDAIEDIHRQK